MDIPDVILTGGGREQLDHLSTFFDSESEMLAWITDGDFSELPKLTTEEGESVAFDFGYLVGAANCLGMSVGDLAIEILRVQKNEWKPVCSPDCQGWVLGGDRRNEVQRCDECARFESDLDAFAFATTEGVSSLREKLQTRITMRTLESDVTRRVEAAFNVEVCVSYVGRSSAGSTFVLQPLDVDSRGNAVLLPNGDIIVSGWPAKRPTTLKKES